MKKIGIDIGGTSVKAAVVDEEYKVLAKAQKPSSECRSSKELVDIVVQTAKEAMEESGVTPDDISFVGVGCPGEVDNKAGIARHADNLPIENIPFVELLSKEFGKPVAVDNDANCAAWGEYTVGVSKGLKDIVTVTLGTGIGGGIIVDGKLLHGQGNHAGEIGHMVIDRGGKRCGCGRVGCWETVASTRALKNEVEAQAQYAPNSRLGRLIAANGGHADGKTLFIAMAEEDNMARGIFNDWIRSLEIGMWNIINIFHPDMIVLSGGVSMEGDAILLPLRQAVGKCTTLIRTGRLGDAAGMIGAAALGEMKD